MTVGIPSFDPTGALRSISPELLLQRIESGRTHVVLDVRGADEFRGPSGHLEGSRSIPLHQLPARRDELLPLRHEPIVIVSNRGVRARLAAFALALAGFEDVVVLDGGFHRWLDLGYRVECGSAPFVRGG